MRTNEKQYEVLTKIITELSFWYTTNDISSPSHYSSIDNMFDLLDAEISDDIKEELEVNLIGLFNIIKKI